MPLHAPRTTRSTTSRDREGAGATRAACVELVPGLWAITGGRSSCWAAVRL